MKNDKLQEALGLLKDSHIAEAATYKKPLRLRWLPAVAAVLTLAILGGILLQPKPPANLEQPSTAGTTRPSHTTAGPSASNGPAVNLMQPKALSLANYAAHNPNIPWAERNTLAGHLEAFFRTSMTQILGTAGSENYTYSPLNLYMALSLLGEVTAGDTEILQLLGTSDLTTLRTRSNLVWNASYWDKQDKALLANSIWLQDGMEYDQEILDTLAQNYFTSSYQAQFGTVETNLAIADWINAQTEDLLKEHTPGIQTDADTMFALYSTVYFRAMWEDGFSPSANTQAVFHGTQDATVTFMNHPEYTTGFYRGEGYTAVGLPLKDGSTMWMILPEAGSSPEALLQDGSCLQMVLDPKSWTGNQKYVKVNLSIPKFDISCSNRLKEDLQALGVTHVFDKENDAFSQFLQTGVDGAVWADDIIQATRVAIDEEGVTAASYIEITVEGDGIPPETVVDFVLDRPFLFVITNDCGLPLFAGVVNNLS